MAQVTSPQKALWLLQRSRDSRAAHSPCTRRILDAAARAGFAASFVRPHIIARAGGAPAVTPPDILVPRSGTKFRQSDLDLIAALERRGSRSLNPAHGLRNARDKAAMTARLRECQCPIPETIVAMTGSELEHAAERIGFPCVLKPLRGSKGVGITLCEDNAALVQAFRRTAGRGALVQRFITEAAGHDIRVLVLNGEVLGAMERFAAPGEFRANASLGGHMRRIEPSAEIQALSLAAADAFDLDFAGIDLLPAPGAPLVCEVNTAPGFEAFEAVTGIDVADCLIRALHKEGTGCESGV